MKSACVTHYTFYHVIANFVRIQKWYSSFVGYARTAHLPIKLDTHVECDWSGLPYSAMMTYHVSSWISA